MARAAVFTRWLSVFYVAFAVNIALGTALRAAGDVVTPLWTGALANVVSVSVAYALVYGKLGLPAMGVAGAAIGHGIGWVVGAIAIGTLWARGRVSLGTGGRSSLSWERTRRLLAIGYPAAMEQIAWQGGFILFLWIIALYGTAPYAAYGIGVNILSFSFLVGFGFSVAAATLVGQHLGAGDPDGAARGGWRAMRLAIARHAAVRGRDRHRRRADGAFPDRRPRGRPSDRRLHPRPRFRPSRSWRSSTRSAARSAAPATRASRSSRS